VRELLGVHITIAYLRIRENEKMTWGKPDKYARSAIVGKEEIFINYQGLASIS
jgi:hypothetical protein